MKTPAAAALAESDARQDVYCRESATCFACGKPKRVGLTLCWPCFREYEEAQWRGNIGLCSWLDMRWRLSERN